MNILDGKLVSTHIKEELKSELGYLKKVPYLVVIQVGDNPSSNIYINNKRKIACEIGIKFDLLKFDINITEEDLISKIEELNRNDEITGIIVQLPLPNHIDEHNIVNSVSSLKDVDGLTDINIGLLSQNKPSIIPCTARGVVELLKYYNIKIEGKNVVIVGRSNLVGKPLMNLMLNENATVTICHTKTEDLKNICASADILISATGCAHLIKSDMVKKNAVVVDVGITSIDGKLYGDVDSDNIKEKVSFISLVPGGVGPMTVIMLMKNVIERLKTTS